MSDPEMDDIVENMLDQPDHSPHELEVLRLGAEFAARVTSRIDDYIQVYEDDKHVTITETDKLKIYSTFFEMIHDDLYDDGPDQIDEAIEEVLRESTTDYAVPG